MANLSHRTRIRSALTPQLRGLIAAAAMLLLTGCGTAPREQAAATTADRSCTSQRVGEARNVSATEAANLTRRMGGHFFRSIRTEPGEVTTFDIEVFRYDDPACARGR